MKSINEKEPNKIPPGESILDSATDIYDFLMKNLSVDEFKGVETADLKLLQKESDIKIAIDKTGMDARYFGDSLNGAAMIKEYIQLLEESMNYLIALMTQIAKFPKPEHRAKLNKAMAHVQKQQQKGTQ